MRTREQLIEDTEPFPDGLIEQLPAGGSRPPLDYVSWHQYAQRLLVQHGGHRYSVTNIAMSPKGGVAVSVRIQFSDDEWYDGVGEGDTPTSAESNAYKRACAHAGIGLHLYESDDSPFWLHGKLQRDNDVDTE